MNTKKGLLVLIALAVMLAAALYVEGSSFVGNKMPNFKLKTLEGKKLKLRDAIKDKAAVINFTTVWCHDCKKLKKILDPIIPQYKEKGVEFCFVYIGKKRKAVSEGYSQTDASKRPIRLLDETREAAAKGAVKIERPALVRRPQPGGHKAGVITKGCIADKSLRFNNYRQL